MGAYAEPADFGDPENSRFPARGSKRGSTILAKTLENAAEERVVDAMQGDNWFESGAYTAVREHFEPIFNAAACRHALFCGVF